MKRLLPLLLVLLLALPTVAPAEEEKVLNILTWADYINGPTILEPFTEETGIQINYDYFDSNEEMLIKLEAMDGGTYDIILASDYIVDITRRQGLMLPLDKAKIPNWDNIDPVFLDQFYDPDSEYTVPYIAGTPLIIYDPAMVDIEITGYESLWDESLRDSLVLIDDARNIIGITLKTMGQSFNVTDEAILQEASDKLMELKPNVRVLDYNRPDLPIVSGEATVGYMFTPGVIWALEERPDLEVVYPVEGMGFGIDSLFIPVNAPHPDNAHQFLDFLLRPEIGVQIAEMQAYVCVNRAAYDLLSDEYKANPALYIPPEILGETEFIQDVGDAQLIYNDIWTQFKQR
ncbi:spermidine/putrescine ABC transporter substrate-binding protein [Eubacteriales bacterium OttesenSCG-928-A19]|nr:spermidine/putrescine ABC transporter substrate-binding protein [Eubacteriales bacterium OttesenSCG-928-A19]